MKSIISAIILVVSIIIYFAYTSPAINDVQVLSSKKSEQSDILLKTRELALKRDAILSDYNNIPSSDIDKLNKIIPDSFNSVLFINDVNSMASYNGLAAKEFKIDDPKTEGREAIVTKTKVEAYKTTIVTLRLQGQYFRFIKFVSDLESSLRLVDVKSISIKSVEAQGSVSGSLEYLLEMNVYSLR
ncbi:MAG TPA: type 4a pilus biogenesis protein PilO [Candidatus Paceibacterota bacterium]|nr:hypothetical protein [uncultured archaeon]